MTVTEKSLLSAAVSQCAAASDVRTYLFGGLKIWMSVIISHGVFSY